MNKKSPVYNVQAVDIDLIDSNAYNPNTVAPPEMRLLTLSIKEDGYTMPIVCYLKENGRYEIVDGYHRYLVMKNNKGIRRRENGRMPVVVIDKPISERMASTVRHNRARGAHGIDLMMGMVAQLVDAGKSDAWIIKAVGMDADELLRLKQMSGLAALFADDRFSKSWK
jgi:ParB-like chromosome segregation protein Spo0J